MEALRLVFHIRIVLMLSMCCFAWALHLNAQTVLCQGELGDNIFTDGDFGTGIPNVVAQNPGFAPGFMYTTQVPPDDGEYTLTNDMRLWSSIFPSWISIGDNDVDPRGYMMVINASFDPGIFYEQIIDNLCENTRYEFSADVINMIRTGVTGHILPNVDFMLNDMVLYSTGNVPQDERWHTYGFTFATAPGQFSVKLSLRNNAPGGIGNDLALDNISFKPCGPEATVSISPEGRICENSLFPLLEAHISTDTGSLQWQVSTNLTPEWTNIPGATDRTHQVQQLQAGQYYFRYLYANTTNALNNAKCRIISQVIPVEIVAVHFAVYDTLCEGLTHELGGVGYGETGSFEFHTIASTGCDSIVTLHLLIVSDPMIEAVFGTTPSSCLGADDGAVTLLHLSDLRPPWQMRVDSVITVPPATSIEIAPGTYTAWIETPYGCFDSSTVVVGEGPLLEVTTSPDTTIVLGYDVLLESITTLPVDSISWTPLQGISCPYCLDTYASPEELTTYTIEVFHDAGCTASAAVTINVDRIPVLYIPNVFTPNGDQINDHFEIGLDPRNIESIDKVLIFDRWGGLIHETNQAATSSSMRLWDGMTSNGPALPGTYVFLIEYSLADGSVGSESGDVTLLW